MNTASRMESNGLPFRIHLSQASQQVLAHRDTDRDRDRDRNRDTHRHRQSRASQQVLVYRDRDCSHAPLNMLTIDMSLKTNNLSHTCTNRKCEHKSTVCLGKIITQKSAKKHLKLV